MLVWLILLAIPLAKAQAKPTPVSLLLPSDLEIRRALAERVNALAGPQDGIGIVVGIIGPQGRRIISYGRLNQRDPRPLNGDTVFEIGSVSKVFTALLLADMVRRGEVALTDPVAKYLPAGVKLPQRNGRTITLLDLATHTSGLPFMPDDERPVVEDSSAMKNSEALLYRFLASYQLRRDIGTDWEYSNLGYWLLGEALAARAGTDYGSLLQTRISAPLNLKSTGVNLSPEMKAHLAVGHNAILQPAQSFSSLSIYAAMPAAGGLVSTVNDLLKFLSSAIGYEPSPLASSMAAMLNSRRSAGAEEQALGWVVSGKGDEQLIMHDGFTWGYSSCLAWSPTSRVGVVVLSNQLTGVADIARHLLRPGAPLEKPILARHNEIALDPAVLDRYAGSYLAEDGGVFKIVRQRGFLTLELPMDWGLPEYQLRSERGRDFFVAELPIRVTFQVGDAGRVSGLLLYPPRGQHPISAKKAASDK